MSGRFLYEFLRCGPEFILNPIPAFKLSWLKLHPYRMFVAARKKQDPSINF